MKKAIYFTYLYHAICFVSMAVGQFMKNGAIVRFSWTADIAGAFLLPLLIAVVTMITSLRDEKRVITQYPAAAATIGAIGLARGVLFFFVSKVSGFLVAMRYLVISFLLLTLWFLIFEISSRMMNSGTKFTRKRK